MIDKPIEFIIQVLDKNAVLVDERRINYELTAQFIDTLLKKGYKAELLTVRKSTWLRFSYKDKFAIEIFM